MSKKNKQELEKLLSLWTDREGCGPQDMLRDILTDLMHIADEQDLDFYGAISGASEVFLEERDE